MNPFLFDAAAKGLIYAMGTAPVTSNVMWAVESTTGDDIPLLVEIGINVGVPFSIGAVDEAISRLWRKHGYKGTKGVLRRVVPGTARAAKFVGRVSARGIVRVLSSAGMRLAPVATNPYVLGSAAAAAGLVVSVNVMHRNQDSLPEFATGPSSTRGPQRYGVGSPFRLPYIDDSHPLLM